MKNLFTLLFSIILTVSVQAQENEIKAVIHKMFKSMYQTDTASLRQCFVPHATLASFASGPSGVPKTAISSVDLFIKDIVNIAGKNFEEKILDWQIFIDDGIASAWTPYEFYFENKLSHCGVNSFQLILEDGKWKITGITDSRRRTACYNEEKEKIIIDSLMNSWHQAAARGDEVAFFGAMTEDGVYIGTDATERWTRDELKAWSARFFERDTAWSFIPVSRHIHIGNDGKTAWLDELLDTWMGTCRSTAILTHEAGRWAIKYYHLSIAVPNEKVDGYLELIKE